MQTQVVSGMKKLKIWQIIQKLLEIQFTEIVPHLKYKGLDEILGDDDYSIYVNSIDTDNKNIAITVFINFMDPQEWPQDLEKSYRIFYRLFWK